jgi:phosphoserine aminotransferase
MSTVYNFNAGPAVLPKAVFPICADAVQNYANTGLSILEMSHRSPEIMAVAEEAVSLVKELLKVPEGYSVLFLQGGASMQFCMVPYNLLEQGHTASYVDTGTWAKKALKEAQAFGNVNVAASSADSNYTYIPKGFKVPADSAYLHITSNNTIVGTQYAQFPQSEVPLIADMSSDIFSRPLDISKFGLIYAGAQKNMGPAGVTLVIVKDSLLGKVTRHIPTMLNYTTHIKKESMFNTPPVFAIYVAAQTMKWLKAQGGVEAIQTINERKAAVLYNEIDSNPLFTGTAVKEDRSLMNVPFVLKDDSLMSEFLSFTKDRNLVGLKGHRSVGGFRASIYNAMSEEGVSALVSAMRAFAEIKG